MADILRAYFILRPYFLELMLAVLVLYTFVSTRRSIARKKSEIEESVDKAIKESIDRIEASIKPRVVFCASIDQVRSEAAEIIRDAATRFSAAAEKQARSIEPPDSDDSDLSQYFITIYGAASLSTDTDDENDHAHPVEIQYRKKYNLARQQASDCKLRFRRYVALLDSRELGARSKKIQGDYIKWLKRQQQDLETDANYTMVHSPRAPRWGSSNTSIIGTKGIIEIKGHGASAFAIYDRRIAADLRASLRANIEESLSVNRRQIRSGDKDSMSFLDNLIRESEAVIGECQNEEDEG